MRDFLWVTRVPPAIRPNKQLQTLRRPEHAQRVEALALLDTCCAENNAIVVRHRSSYVRFAQWNRVQQRHDELEQ